MRAAVSEPLANLRKSVDAQEPTLKKLVTSAVAELRTEFADRERESAARIDALKTAGIIQGR